MPKSVLGESRGASEAGSGPRIKTKGGPVSASRESPARAKPADGGLGEEKGREEVVDQRVLSRTWEKSKLGAGCSWEQNHRSRLVTPEAECRSPGSSTWGSGHSTQDAGRCQWPHCPAGWFWGWVKPGPAGHSWR